MRRLGTFVQSLNRSGQTLVSLLVASVIGLIVLLGTTDLLNYLGRAQKSNDISVQFVSWKNAISGLLKNQQQCSAALIGQPVNTDGSCTQQAKVFNPAGCSVAPNFNTTTNCVYAGGAYIGESVTCNDPRRITPQLCCVAAGGTWTPTAGSWYNGTCAGATPGAPWTQTLWLGKPATLKGYGLEVSSLCLSTTSAQQKGNGRYQNEVVYNTTLNLTANKPADAVGATSLSATFNFDVTVDSSVSPPIVKNCGGPHDQWTTMGASPLAARAYYIGAADANRVIIYGGTSAANASGSYFSDGAVYDVPRDKWMTMNTTGAPAAMSGSAAWFNNSLVVWEETGDSAAGGPTPSPTPLPGGPSPTPSVTCGWWTLNNLYTYSPDTPYYDANTATGPIGTWTRVTSAPFVPRGSEMTPMGTKRMFFFGGSNNQIHFQPNGSNCVAGTLVCPSTSCVTLNTCSVANCSAGACGTYACQFNDGGYYDFGSNIWTAFPFAPIVPRYWAIQLWTGAKAIVWGGV